MKHIQIPKKSVNTLVNDYLIRQEFAKTFINPLNKDYEYKKTSLSESV